LDLQLPMQSVPITASVVSSNLNDIVESGVNHHNPIPNVN